MDFAYQDIIGLGRPSHADDAFSRRHPKMARLNRAKLFAPFAALSGYDEAIRAKEIQYVPRRVPDADGARELDLALNLLYRARTPVTARVVYFEVCADANSEGFGRLGQYRTETGIVRRVEPAHRRLRVGDRVIPFRDILAITAPDGERLPGAGE